MSHTKANIKGTPSGLPFFIICYLAKMMTPNDLKKGDRYKYTQKWINANPWCARGIYTHQGNYSDYEPTRSDPSYIDLKVLHGAYGHMYCEVELVV